MRHAVDRIHLDAIKSVLHVKIDFSRQFVRVARRWKRYLAYRLLKADSLVRVTAHRHPTSQKLLLQQQLFSRRIQSINARRCCIGPGIASAVLTRFADAAVAKDDDLVDPQAASRRLQLLHQQVVVVVVFASAVVAFPLAFPPRSAADGIAGHSPALPAAERNRTRIRFVRSCRFARNSYE